MSQFLALTIVGIATYGCIYALTAMGLVVTYTTTGVFNFAQGAIGMLGAFLYWQLAVDFGWPSWLAFVVVVFGCAPLLGAGIERVIMRRLENAGLEAHLTVTIALLILGIAIATIIWDPTVGRRIPQLFNGQQISIGDTAVTGHQLVVVGAAVAAAAALRLFLYRTRAGIATRAVVDDRELTALTGAMPARYAQLGWAMGCSLASMAGILIAPIINLNITVLTLLVINGYAAAMVGRLRNLPLTFAGGIVLGLIQSYAIGYLPIGGLWTDLMQVLPMLFLLVVMLVLPQNRARLARRVRVRAARVAGLRESLITAGVFVAVAAVFAHSLSTANLGYANRGMALAIIMLSLVLLTGYGGQVSLCQMTFAGIGAFVMSKVGGTDGSLIGVIAAIGVTTGLGVLVALPALRLRGLYLALTTAAFAVGVDRAFFTNTRWYGVSISVPVSRPDIPGISLDSDGAYLILLSVVFAGVGTGLLALRRSGFGRRLLAISDSPTACLSVGVDMAGSKLVVFALSAGLAGFGGALYGGAQGTVTPNDFAFMISLSLLLLAVTWGIRTIGGMVLAGVTFALGPLLQEHVSQPRNVVSLMIGLAAIGVAQNPEGTFGGDTPLRRWRERRRPATEAVAIKAEEVRAHAAS